MKPQDRIVTHLPMERLWNDSGELQARRVRDLARDDIRELLRTGPVQFVVANGGDHLRWIPIGERFEFWKHDVDAHLAKRDRIDLDDFPGGKAYVASEWAVADEQVPVIVLEVYH